MDKVIKHVLDNGEWKAIPIPVELESEFSNMHQLAERKGDKGIYEADWWLFFTTYYAIKKEITK